MPARVVLPAFRRYSSASALCLALASATAACLIAEAASSVGDARVTVAEGQPCFSVPAGKAANAPPLRLHALTVTQTERADWRSLPAEMWGFTVDPPGLAVDSAGSGACIRYGVLPQAGRGHGPARPLEGARLYRVEINARPENGDSSTLGYEARFCVKPQVGGAADVRVVLWDENARRWRDEVCLRD